MLKQKDAVYNAVISVLKEHGVSHEDGEKVTLTKEQRDQVVGMLVTGFEKNQIELESQQENIKSYTGGLVSNWLRKDKRFNGNTTYQPSNPGSRTGQADPMVKNLRILLGTLAEGTEAYEAVQAKIDARVSEIKGEKAKAKAKDIDFSVIPDDIKALLD